MTDNTTPPVTDAELSAFIESCENGLSGKTNSSGPATTWSLAIGNELRTARARLASYAACEGSEAVGEIMRLVDAHLDEYKYEYGTDTETPLRAAVTGLVAERDAAYRTVIYFTEILETIADHSQDSAGSARVAMIANRGVIAAAAGKGREEVTREERRVFEMDKAQREQQRNQPATVTPAPSVEDLKVDASRRVTDYYAYPSTLNRVRIHEGITALAKAATDATARAERAEKAWGKMQAVVDAAISWSKLPERDTDLLDAVLNYQDARDGGNDDGKR